MRGIMRGLRRFLKFLWISVVLLPLVCFGLWFGGGRETLTKSLRAVEAEKHDEVFGDQIDRTFFVHGPVLGYFVGLDAVAITCGLSLTLLTFAGWRRARRRPNPSEPAKESM